MRSPRSALLWMTHVWNPELEAEFKKLREMDGSGLPEVWLLLDARTPGAETIARGRHRCRLMDEAGVVGRLGYGPSGGLRFFDQMHLPLIDFWLSHPDYEHYWLVEYDVRYTGDWGVFLESFNDLDHDLLTTHVRRFSDEPYWYWWDSLSHPERHIPREERARSLNVIYRMSSRALDLVHEEQSRGWRGHPEVLLPTLLLHNGYTVMDLGGDGPFTPEGLRGRAYSSDTSKAGRLVSPFGTVRWRPSWSSPGRRADTIYHPVKPAALREPFLERCRYLLSYLIPDCFWRK